MEEIYLYLHTNIRKMKKRLLPWSATLLFLISLLNPAYSQNNSPAHPYSEPKVLQDFLCSEVVYPEKALNAGEEGKVVLSFIVKKDGSTSDVRVKESAGPELDAEAKRLFSLVLWEPAISLGQPVDSECEFPVNFNIKKYNKHCKTMGYETSDYPYTPVDSSLAVYNYADVDKKPYPVFEMKGMTLSGFISKNIKYPEVAYKQSISGKVTLQFVVELNGRVSNIKALIPIGGGCTQEAIRLLQLLSWMPGIEKNVAVRTLMKIDVDFKLPENSDMEMFENSQMNSN
jgi:TonB family protein